MVDSFVRFFIRWVPDSFVIAIILTLLTFFLSVVVGGYSAKETVSSWGGGFWNLLRFTNQITLTLLLGYALANTPPIRRLLYFIAGKIRTPAMAYSAVSLVTGICALLSWGLALITAGIFARAVGETCRRTGVKVHYPLLVASAFSGFVIWHQGLSSSIGLTLATSGHFLEAQTGIIPLGETLFTSWNMLLAATVLLTLPLFMSLLKPANEADIVEFPEALMATASTSSEDESLGADSGEDLTPAERMEQSKILNYVIILIGAVYLYFHFIELGEGLTLNIFNFAFLFGGMLLAGSPAKYLEIIIDGGRVASVFLLQYPFYAGVAAVMGDSGLADMLVAVFVNASTAETLPLFSFLSGGVLNMFIPSGGGQWVVQGPIMVAAAQSLGADLPRVAMSVALGDQWTNLIQPLSIVPVIAIAQVPLRQVMGYCFFAFIFSGVVFSAALYFF
ncbi:MAG: short-chain fatty acids transporter [Candidatus Azotimanducaceae bacterium]